MLLYISQQADPICANTTNISDGKAGDLTTKINNAYRVYRDTKVFFTPASNPVYSTGQ